MNNQEYRLGNIVFTDDDYPFTTITFIGKDLIGVEGGESWEGVYNVPLTKEWILKFGELRASFSHQPEFYLEWHEDSKTWNCYKPSYGDQVLLASIEFVHQLQNLFFALTGEELTIKP